MTIRTANDVHNILYSNRFNTREGWQLVDKDTGEEIKVGDIRNTSRDEAVEIVFLQPPHKASSQGKVCVKSVEEGWNGQYYASVVNGVYNYVGVES